MADTLSDSVAKAFDSMAPDASDGAPALQRDSGPTPAPEMEYRSEQPVSSAEEVVDDRPTVESVNKDKAQRERDEKGRFAAKDSAKGEKEPAPEEIVEPAAPEAEAAAGPSAETTGSPAEAASDRAPANWKPAAREHWSKLPAEVKQEALRVHAEVNKALQETAEARRNYSEIKEAIAPYEAAMRASGYTPARALQEYGQLNYTVHQGTGQQLGQVMAQMLAARQDPERATQAIAQAIRALNVDYDRLNSYLEDHNPGYAAQQAPIDVNAAVEQALAQRLQYVAQQKRQQEEQAFAAKNEFFEDVAPRMRAIRAADPSLSLDEAYRIACQVDPEISKVLQQRNAAKAAQETAKKAAAAKAASGVKPSPAVAVATKSGDLKSTVAAAFDAASNRR